MPSFGSFAAASAALAGASSPAAACEAACDAWRYATSVPGGMSDVNVFARAPRAVSRPKRTWFAYSHTPRTPRAAGYEASGA